MYTTMTAACIIGVSGRSGSGKTTLIESVLPELVRGGLRVAVVKHTTHHRLDIDKKGKDTARFFDAGADLVVGQDEDQTFFRSRRKYSDLNDVLQDLPPGLDLVIIEGHKQAMVRRVWLEAGRVRRSALPSGVTADVVLSRQDKAYRDLFLRYIEERLAESHGERAVYAGLLVGGKSTRMGTSKAFLKIGGRSFMKRSYDLLSASASRTVLLGSSPVPPSLRQVDRLPDVSGAQGPLAGMISAFRWAPHAAWIISAVDMPLMGREAWEWILSHRRPGVWAVIPRFEEAKGGETTAACYEPMLFEFINDLTIQGTVTLQPLVRHPKVVSPVIPAGLAHCWKNVNTPADWKEARELLLHRPC
jgi:molybdopterin-guanine dinucleotide biosynthesis protein MobB